MEDGYLEAQSLIDLLPDDLYTFALAKPVDDLIEIVLDLGRPMSCRYADGTTVTYERKTTQLDLQTVLLHDQLGQFGSDNRAGISGTLHRVSRIFDRGQVVVGLTLRVGRLIESSIELIADLLDTGKGVLFIGAPGKGKTTLIRQAARYLSTGAEKRVMIVDTSCEIAGDGIEPHAAVGSSRRMMVPRRELQYQIMVEAVQNHTPEVLIIDELGNRQEGEAAASIAERGVQLVASAHGNTLESVVHNKQINDIVGRVVDATISDALALKNGSSKVILQRRNRASFGIAVEVLDFDKLAIHHDLDRSVDLVLKGATLHPEVRWIGEGGKMLTRPELYVEAEEAETSLGKALKVAGK